jgi:hypothetical protein
VHRAPKLSKNQAKKGLRVADMMVGWKLFLFQRALSPLPKWATKHNFCPWF